MAEKIRYVNEKKRLGEKAHPPTEEFVRLFMGDDAWRRLERFEDMLRQRYDLNRELKFPFGSGEDYGWGFRYTNKKTLLLYVFFEEGGFCCTISINDAGAPQVEAMLDSLHPAMQAMWANRYGCGAQGGWLNRSVAGDDELPDLVRLVGVKVKPKKGAR